MTVLRVRVRRAGYEYGAQDAEYDDRGDSGEGGHGEREAHDVSTCAPHTRVCSGRRALRAARMGMSTGTFHEGLRRMGV